MKVKVVKEFVDKHTKKLHKVNETFDCNAKRYEEILKTGAFVAPVEKAEKAEKQE
jgi:hypothetical protein